MSEQPLRRRRDRRANTLDQRAEAPAGATSASGHGHLHAHGAQAGGAPAALVLPPMVRRALAAAVVLAGLTAVLALAMTWPDRAAAQRLTAANDAYGDVDFVEGSIVGLRLSRCEGGTGEDRRPDGTVAPTVDCAKAEVRVDGLSGPLEIDVPVPATRAGLGVGDRIRLSHYPATAELPEVYAYAALARRGPLLVLGAAFVLGVAALARWRGVVSVVGLALAYGVVGVVVLPSLQVGRHPVVTTAGACVLVMLFLLFAVHGLNGKTAAAFLGTVAGLAVTTVLAVGAAAYAGLDGLVDEQSVTLSRLTTHGGLRDVVVCGLIIGSLGVLNDVTVTQASAVWELRAASPLRAGQLFVAGMRIGRDHLSSTVYTVAFAYVGAALPTLLLVDLYGRPVGDLLQSSAVAEEIVGVVVAGLGLAASIPLTTLVAALAASAAPRPTAA
ncbi:MAG: YibE/F family protein [Kineosporiaceae bacterium]